jgi:peptide deformylase
MKVVKYGPKADVLRQIAEPVTEFDEELKALVEEMFVVMRSEKGIGLAAPQVGVSKRVIVVDVSKHYRLKPFAMINPEIVERSEDIVSVSEGCLSIPGVNYKVTRASTIRVAAIGIDGIPTKTIATGILSIVLQHEIDHLNGVLFVDYIDDPVLSNKIKGLFKLPTN